MIYYHLTTPENLESILQNGLKPHVGPRSACAKEEKPRIYLCGYEDMIVWSNLLNLTKAVQISDKANLEPKIADITSIRMTIAKWSTPNACAKILQFYDKLYEEYHGDALQMFEVNEEMCSSDGNYNINSDTMTVTLHNTDRKFVKGYLRSLMLLGSKISPSIGIEKNGEVVYRKLGTFFS